MKRPLRWVRVLVLAAAGLAALATGVWHAWRLAGWSSVEGEVVRVDRLRGAYYVAVVEYRAGGNTYRVDGPREARRSSYRAGERVAVGYPSGRPQGGRVLDFLERWHAALAAVGLGLLAAAGLAARGRPVRAPRPRRAAPEADHGASGSGRTRRCT